MATVRSKAQRSSGVWVIAGMLVVALICVGGGFLGSLTRGVTPSPTPVLEPGMIIVVTRPVPEGKYMYQGKGNKPLEVGERLEFMGRTGLFASSGKEILQVVKVDDESYYSYVTLDDGYIETSVAP